MRFFVSLTVALSLTWLVWSGHFENVFLLVLGLVSAITCVAISRRMGIVDQEGAPVQLGLRPFYRYAPWLAVEVAKANWKVTRALLSRKIPLRRNVIWLATRQQTTLGRVIFANSITLTPGTVAIEVEGDKVMVHSLAEADADAEALVQEMNRRISRLERKTS